MSKPDLDNTYASLLDSWTAFAAAKRVRRLELDLSSFLKPNRSLDEIYCFPSASSLEWKALTSLVLHSVDLVEEHLLHLFSDCPLLEKLSGLEAIEVVPALNFSCFVYKGPTINMLFADVPQLSSVSLIGAPNNRIDFCKDSVITKFDQFPFSMSQLQMLALDLDMVVVKSYYLFPNTFPEFRNIR
ncbi:uncharacterized protein LOC113771940 [Coffea eugenioides]|uniref:uncharacterized protein LOC113771940 n=1 Tax=Coffea eugenioides TaxID=49369 RepID=UPI000F610CF0|nr:uncharacterized protein LOC113771940 [Coffea eugenioides]